MLLPHNNDVTKPHALNTFLDELAELGFDKGLIKNKNLLSDLIEKEKRYRNAEDTSDNESNNEESSSDIKNQEEQVEEEEEEEVASENGSEAEGTQESENDSQETGRSSHEKSTTFHSENPCEHCENSNVYGTLIMKCPNCFWQDYYESSPICDPDPGGEKLHQRGLSSVSRLWSDYTQKREDVGNQFLCPFLRVERGRGIFISIPFKWLCISVFLLLFFKKRSLLSGFIACVY